jgi:phospholipid/cholesterol/gamma-HCH transport system substrate-binding protein
MGTETSQHIKLGLFVTIGIALFAAGIYFIGDAKQLFSKTFSMSAMFNNVNGLQVGNNVRFAGINVGTVENIQIITDTSVQVDMVVDVSTQQFIKKDAKAIIGSDGLMGNKILNISAGTKGHPQIEDNDMIGTTLPVSFDDMLANLKTTTDNTTTITNDLADIMANIHSGKGTIGKLFMDTVFAENLDKTIVNVKQGTKGFKQNMDAAQQSILLRGYFKKKAYKKKK